MFLSQKLEERKWLKQKISELKGSAYKFTAEQDSVLEKILLLFDELQTINLILHKVNNESVIEIAGTELNLNTAIELRKTMKAKIDLITELIALDEGVLDILLLMEQRDSLLGEYSAMDSAINQADWNIKID